MAQITRFEDVCLIRETNAAYLKEQLSKVPGIMPQEFYPGPTAHRITFWTSFQ